MNTIPKFKTGLRAAAAWGLIIGCLALPGTVLGQDKKEPSPLVAAVPLKLTGFSQFLYTAWDKGVDSFSARRVRFSLSGELFKNVNYKIQVDAVKSPLILDALVEFKLSSEVGLRVGQFKVPFSTENLTSSADLATINRSQPEEKLAPGRDTKMNGRDIGAALFGKWSVLEYTLGVFNGSGIDIKDNNSQKDVGGRVVVRPVEFLALGAAFYRGRTSIATGSPAYDRDRTGLELAVLHGPFSLKGEYIFAKDDKLERSGWYIQGGWFLKPKKLQAVLKLDSYDKDRKTTDNRTNLSTVGLNWFLTAKSKLQVNYELYKLEGGKTDNSAFLVQLQAGF
ncbi:MAG: OprO/OprP family phosphate-selective porin [Candidatus Aminicenantes bacterium]|nr:OprO/OprP family phosphate-selective porin [Candidatus Aminicenantes bacterium]